MAHTSSDLQADTDTCLTAAHGTKGIRFIVNSEAATY